MESKNDKSLLALIAIAAIIFIGGIIATFLKTEKEQAISDTETVKAIVAEFGTKLQMVPLLAPKEVAAGEIRKQYSPFVAPELLSRWENDPSNAPGRLVSSPWPDRIQISSATKESTDSYRVEGDVIEVTSRETSQGGIAAAYPVSITLRRINNAWLIVEFEKGPYR